MQYYYAPPQKFRESNVFTTPVICKIGFTYTQKTRKSWFDEIFSREIEVPLLPIIFVKISVKSFKSAQLIITELPTL